MTFHAAMLAVTSQQAEAARRNIDTAPRGGRAVDDEDQAVLFDRVVVRKFVGSRQTCQPDTAKLDKIPIDQPASGTNLSWTVSQIGPWRNCSLQSPQNRSG
jgi:hypothetical protein